MKAQFTVLVALAALFGCKEAKKEYEMGTYGYDKAFFAKHGIECLELSSADGAAILVIPAWQGRVMTSSAAGDTGDSYGWINYKFIEEGVVSPQFNPTGGEERFWIGPEGGPYSVYFAAGAEQVYENWKVPAVIDTEAFDILSKDASNVTFSKSAELSNASGTKFNIAINRKVSLLDKPQVSKILGTKLGDGLKMAAYTTENKIINQGDAAWTKESGLLSIWMLGMFNPTPTTTVFIPYNRDGEGIVANDEYFGKVPADRLKIDTAAGMIYFKIDGAYRSKIGLPNGRAPELAAGYDSDKKVLTLLQFTLPEQPVEYLNGQWGPQTDSYNGDVINSYNDGPVDGKVMGPFYEIETSSPGIALAPGQAVTHIQSTMHIQGDETQLDELIYALFGIDLQTITSQFK